MPKEHRRNIFSYYAFCLLSGFYIANGTTVLFERQLGLSFSQIFTLDAVYMLMFILFEIPTGALADLLGRKKTLIFGLLALALAGFASGSAHSYLQLFLSYFIWAFGFSLLTGTGEAMLYDNLKDESLYQRVYGKASSLQIVGMALSGFAGPLLFAQNFRFPYYFSSLPFLAAAIAILFFHETIVSKVRFSFARQLTQMKEGAQLAFGNRYVLWSMGALSLVFAVGYTFTSLYQPYLIDIGFSVRAFALIIPAMFLIEAFGGIWSQRITTAFGENGSFWVNFLTVGVCLFILGFFANKAVLPVLLLYGFVQGVLRPFLSTYTNRYIDSAHRATVISVQGMFGTITASAVLFSFGFLTDKIGVIALAEVMGIAVLIVGTLLLLVRPR